jgi:catechol 2,3-dioxygenase-like lactoylglutathione lyase family enzyme
MLQHAALEVPPGKVEECVAFWALLGFERATKPPRLRTSSTWVEREGTQIHLLPMDEPVVAVRGHIAIVAPDYDDVLRALAAAGFEVTERENAWDAPRSEVHDPAGHVIEVMSRAP